MTLAVILFLMLTFLLLKYYNENHCSIFVYFLWNSSNLYLHVLTVGLRGHIPDFYQYLESYQNPYHTSNAHPLLRATPPPPGSRTVSESDSIQKAPWEFEYPNILENYMEGRFCRKLLIIQCVRSFLLLTFSGIVEYSIKKSQWHKTASSSSNLLLTDMGKHDSPHHVFFNSVHKFMSWRPSMPFQKLSDTFSRYLPLSLFP